MKRMSMKHILMSLTLLGSVAMPTFALANGLQYSGGSWNAQSSFILKVIERPEIGGKGIYSYDSEMFRESPLLGKHREQSSDTTSHSDSVGPSVDMPNSVNGDTGGLERHFRVGRGPEGGDSAVEGLSRMDGGGFSSPGGGSVPGYHGR